MLLSFHSLCSASLLSLITHTQRGISSSNSSSCYCSRHCVQQTSVLHRNYYGLDSEKIEIQGNEGTQHIKKKEGEPSTFSRTTCNMGNLSERMSFICVCCLVLPVSRSDQISCWLCVCLWLPRLGNWRTNSSRQRYENLFVTLRSSCLFLSQSISLTQSPASVAFFFASHLCSACVRVCYFRNELKLAQLQQTCNVVGSGSYGRLPVCLAAASGCLVCY